MGIVAPLACRQAGLRHRLDGLAVPIVSLEVGTLFAVNYVAAKVLERLASPHAIVEIKECNAALIWCGLGVAALVQKAALYVHEGAPHAAVGETNATG